MNRLEGIPPIRSRAHLRWLFAQMCGMYGVSPSEILESNHSREMVDFRREFARAAHGLGYSTPSIGAILHRHHTSILHLLRKK